MQIIRMLLMQVAENLTQTSLNNKRNLLTCIRKRLGAFRYGLIQGHKLIIIIIIISQSLQRSCASLSIFYSRYLGLFFFFFFSFLFPCFFSREEISHIDKIRQISYPLLSCLLNARSFGSFCFCCAP